VSFVWQLIYLFLYLFLLLLLGRLVMEYVLAFAPRWRDRPPGKRAAAAMELMWSATDPPLKALRRVIPPLRIGSVSLDLGFLLLLMIVSVLMSVVSRLY
jgi:YggT family protein